MNPLLVQTVNCGLHTHKYQDYSLGLYLLLI